MSLAYSLLLGLHLLMVGAASAAPIYCVWLEWKDGRGDSLAGRAGRFLAAASFWLLCIGALVGLAVGALAWRPEFRDGLSRLGLRLHAAIGEWIFSVALIGGHALWWKLAPRPRTWVRVLRAILPLLAGTNLLYHFPMFFHVLEQVIAEGAAAAQKGVELAAEPMSGGEFRRRMMSAPVLARATHFWLASFAGGGLLLVWFGRSIVRPSAAAQEDGGEEAAQDGRRAIAWGSRAGLLAAFLQLPVGLWLMMQLPSATQRLLLGGDMVAAGFLVVGVFTSLGLMHFLSSLALARARSLATSDLRIRAAVVVALGGTVFLLMTGAAQRAKADRARPIHSTVERAEK